MDFFNRLNDAHISDSQYEHAQRAWTEFQCDTQWIIMMFISRLMYYYQQTSLKSFAVHACLDPLHYYTTPGLAWEAALKMSRVNLELITDIDMYTFIEEYTWWNLHDFDPVCC